MYQKIDLITIGKSNDVISLAVSAAIQNLTQFNRRFLLLPHLRRCFCHHFIAQMQWILRLKVSKDRFDRAKSNDVISLAGAAIIHKLNKINGIS